MTEIHAKSILRVRRRIDPWFISRYGLNLYRGCAHGCAYCDGCSEAYQAPEDFSGNIQVKANALAVLEREFERLVQRKQKELLRKCGGDTIRSSRASAHIASRDGQLELFETQSPAEHAAQEANDATHAEREHTLSGFLTLGGGVSDQYQPLEKKYELARGVLKLCVRFRIPVHILTKSTLVLRDLDLLREINRETRALVSVSISTLDPAQAAIVEPGAPPPRERLAMFEEFRAAGIACGVFLLPVLPFLSDTPAAIEESIAASARAGARYLLFGGLTLKQGRQTDHYMACLAKNFPAAAEGTRHIYRWANRHGIPNTPQARERWQAAEQAADQAIRKHGLARNIPFELAAPFLSEEDKKFLLSQ